MKLKYGLLAYSNLCSHLSSQGSFGSKFSQALQGTMVDRLILFIFSLIHLHRKTFGLQWPSYCILEAHHYPPPTCNETDLINISDGIS